MPSRASKVSGVATSSISFSSKCRYTDRKALIISLIYFVIGFSPITALAIAIFQLVPLYMVTFVLVIPLTLLGIVLGIIYPFYGKLAIKGILIGMFACLLYDTMRVPFILAHVWGDFIPKIGGWLLNTGHPNAIIGYVWRYIGDGGFMGMAFVVGYSLMRPVAVHRVQLLSLGFGIGIWLCLVLTVIFAPQGKVWLFSLTPTTITLSFLGHVIYGYSIGFFILFADPSLKQSTLLRKLQALTSRRSKAEISEMTREGPYLS